MVQLKMKSVEARSSGRTAFAIAFVLGCACSQLLSAGSYTNTILATPTNPILATPTASAAAVATNLVKPTSTGDIPIANLEEEVTTTL